MQDIPPKIVTRQPGWEQQLYEQFGKFGQYDVPHLHPGSLKGA